jgi:hypothetical protein
MKYAFAYLGLMPRRLLVVDIAITNVNEEAP